MAMSSSTKHDILQVCVLTFALLSVFFGATGVWYHFYKVPAEIEARNKQNLNLTNLIEVLETPEYITAVQEWHRVRESEKESQNLRAGVNKVLAEAGGRFPPTETFIDQRPKPLSGGKLIEHTLRVEFKHASLRQGLVQFLFEIEAKLPSVNFKSVKLGNKSKRGTYEDIWSSEYLLVSVTGESVQ